MVDLPIPEQGDVLAQTPTPRVSGFQYARAGSYLSQGLDKLSDGINDIAVPMAKDQAAQDLQNGSAVTRDANGNIQVGKPAGMPILGPAGEAYAHAIAAGQLAQGDNQATQDVAQLRAANEGNPAKFLQAGQSYTQNLLVNNPGPTGQAMADRAGSMISQHYAGMVQQQAQVGVTDAKQSIVDARSNAFNELSTLAQNGVSSGPDWDKSLSNWQATSRQLVANPAFGVTQQLQDANDKDESNLLHQFSVVGSVDADVKKNGVVVARANLNSAIHDPNSQLSPQQQESLYRAGEGRIQFIVSQNAADAAVNRENVNALREHAMDPNVSASLSEPIWQAALAKSQGIPGAETETALLSTAHQAWQVQRGVSGLSPQQQAVQQGVQAPGAPAGAVGYNPTTGAYLTGATQNRDGSPPPPVVNGAAEAADHAAGNANIAARSDLSSLDNYKARVAQIESGGNPNAVSPTGAIGKYQFLPSTLKHFGGTIGGDQEAPMNAMTAQNQAALAHGLGRAPSPGELYLAHQQGEGGALQLLQNPTARAGDIVGDQAVRVNGGDPNASAATFTNMWVKKFEGGAGTTAPVTVPSSAPGGHFTQAQLTANPFLISSWVQSVTRDPDRQAEYGRDLGAGIEASVRNGTAPSVQTMAAYTQIAASQPKLMEQAQRIQASVEGMALGDTAIGGVLSDTEKQAFAASGFHNLPRAQGQAYVDAVKQASQGGSIYQMQVAQSMSEYYDRGMKQLKEDPLGTAALKGWGKSPDPLNVDDPNALAVGFHQRSDLFDSIAAHGAGNPTSSALDPAGAAQLRDTIAGGSGQQIQNITAALATVPQSRRDATIADLGPAIVGAANSGDPSKMKAAYGFLGQQFDMNPVDFRKDFGKDTANQLLAYRNAMVFLPPDVAAKRVQGWSDPAQEETRNGIAEIAKKELSSVTPSQVAQNWSTFSVTKPWTWGGVQAQTPTTDAAATSAIGLHADYSDAYIKQRQLGMDAAHAQANAISMLSTKWGVSGVNGNMVMPYPPESKYPAVGGSHAWISEQLDRDVYEATGASAARPEVTASYGEPQNAQQRGLIMERQAPLQYPDSVAALKSMATYNAPRALASDSTTEADITAGKPPSYYIVTKDDRGLWNPLTDQRGSMVRFRPDPQAIPGVSATHAPGFTTGGWEAQARARITAGPHQFVPQTDNAGP